MSNAIRESQKIIVDVFSPAQGYLFMLKECVLNVSHKLCKPKSVREQIGYQIHTKTCDRMCCQKQDK